MLVRDGVLLLSRPAYAVPVAVISALLAACSGADESDTDDGSSGSSSVAPGVGGSADGTGGSVSAGGSPTGGTSAGGTAPVGIGGQGVGGSIGAGGSATGGTSAGGTDPGVGGADPGTGGSSSGGANAGGTVGLGGAETGGAVGMGGAETGGTTGSGGATPSSGCGTPWSPVDLEIEEESWSGPAAQVVRREMEVAGATREVLVAVPIDYDPNVAYPLVFGFHGRGGDREQLRRYMNVEEPADGQAIVIYPQGLLVDETDTGWDLGADSADLLLVDALIEQYTQELCIDEDRLFATGHSFGGCMSNSVGCYRGEVFRAIAPVAGCGPLGWNVSCTGQVAALMIHSPNDTATEYSSGITGCNTWLTGNQCDQQPECGCHWVDALTDPSDECVQEAQQPYTPGVTIEVTDADLQPPVFREYVNCDPGYPVVFADHWNGDDPRYHNPPPWAEAVIWEFFSSLP